MTATKSIIYIFVIVMMATATMAAEPSYGGKALSQWVAELKSSDVATRTRAAEAISKLGAQAEPAVPALATMLTSDESWKGRLAATACLMVLGPKAKGAVPALLQALKDPEDNVRRGAVVALGAVGPGATEAVPALTALASDRDELVRQLAADSLHKIQSAAPSSTPGGKKASTANRGPQGCDMGGAVASPGLIEKNPFTGEERECVKRGEEYIWVQRDHSAPAKEPHVRATTTRVAALAADSALLKLILVDAMVNLVGVESDRAPHVKKLQAKLDAIGKKYGFTPKDLVPFKLDAGNMGGGTHPEASGFVRTGDKWSEILVFEKKTGKLPRVSFRKGKVSLLYASASVRFDDETECLIDGKEYIHQKGQWVPR